MCGGGGTSTEDQSDDSTLTSEARTGGLGKSEREEIR